MTSGGIKVHDLNLFREASSSRSVNIVNTGGDVFITSGTSSDMAVLWGENFGAKERKFLREMLTTETVCFSLEDDTYQMNVRTLWHASSVSKGTAAMHGMRRQGKFVLLLHDLHGELTTSWTFAKFIRPLYRRSFSVLAADLPGYGKSAMSQVCSCPISRWQAFSSHIIIKIMEELGLTKSHMVVIGHSAGLLIKIMLNTPHRVEGRHVVVNPIFDRNQLFGYVGSDLDPPPGAKAGWRQEIKERQMAEFVKMIRTNGIKLWFIFDRNGKHTELMSGKKAPNRKTQEEWEQAYDTHEFLVTACRDEFAAINIKMTEVTQGDLCEAQCGKKVPVRMLVPSRHLKSSIARYLADHWNLPWQDAYMPKHVLHGMKGQKVDKALLGLDYGTDDSDDEQLDTRQGIMACAVALTNSPSTPSKQLQMLQGNATIQSPPSSATLKPIEWSPATPQSRASKAIELHSASPHGSRSNASTLMRSASESPLRPPSKSSLRARDSSLGAAAVVAKEKLRKSGAMTQPLPTISANGKKQMNWSSVPFEPDLSYGVRKMFLDAFEASVDTYRDEQEKEVALKEQHRSRSAFREANRKGVQIRSRADDSGF